MATRLKAIERHLPYGIT